MTEDWELKLCSTEEKTDQEQLIDYNVTNNNTHASLCLCNEAMLYIVIKWQQGNK